MADNLFSKLTNFLNKMVDVISQGNLQRVQVINQMNIVFKEAYFNGEIDKYCKVSTAAGNPQFKHELSTFYMRSGFKITIENDSTLSQENLVEISRYIIESKPFVRQLMALGYDTLIMAGRTSYRGMQISLKEIANFQNYMLR